jgi:hypothetical protein
MRTPPYDSKVVYVQTNMKNSEDISWINFQIDFFYFVTTQIHNSWSAFFDEFCIDSDIEQTITLLSISLPTRHL